jgi:hypothetical protein
LEWLGLAETGVTNAGIPHLLPLKRLSHLFLQGTKVTYEGVEPLRKELKHLSQVELDEPPWIRNMPAGSY